MCITLCVCVCVCVCVHVFACECAYLSKRKIFSSMFTFFGKRKEVGWEGGGGGGGGDILEYISTTHVDVS